MSVNFNNFVGTIAVGNFVHTGSTFTFKATKSLGSAFVINPKEGLIVTCNHVFPRQDRNQLACFVTINPEKEEDLSYYLIKNSSAQQFDDKDLIVLKIQENPSARISDLKSYELSDAKLNLGAQVVGLGLPKNHLSGIDTNIDVRAITSFVQMDRGDGYEVVNPFIKNMSGGPVFYKDKVVGIIQENIQIGLEVTYHEEKETDVSGNQITKIESKAKHLVQVGYFFACHTFLSWLKDSRFI